MTTTTTTSKKPELHGWKLAIVGGVLGLIALGLAVYSAAASYKSVSGLATRLDVPLPQWNPLGIDGGLAGVILFSIVLIWIGKPIGWLRLAARLFAAGTIAANAAAGWPDPAGIGLRIAAPVLFVVIIEATYTLLVGRDRDARGEGIPLARWLLDWRTFFMWRRMKLWGVRSYTTAIEIEISRQRAIVKLRAMYGSDWTSGAPADLVWLLRNGVHIEEAIAAVAQLTSAAHQALDGPARQVAHEPAHEGPGRADGPAQWSTGGPAREPAEVAHPVAHEPVASDREPQPASRPARAATRQKPLDRDAEAAAARKAYRDSVEAGTPLSKRQLADIFSRSPNWGQYRINEVKNGPQLAQAQAQ